MNKIVQGDCLELLERIPNDSVDVTFADPPFNLGKQYNGYKDSLALETYIDWCSEWIKAMVRVTKPSGSVLIHNIPRWLTFYAGVLNETAHFRHWIVWDAPTSPMGKSLQPNHYGVLFYTKSDKKAKIYELRMPHERERKSTFLRKDYGGKKAGLHPFGPLISDVWSDIHRIKHSKSRHKHPCQLPVHLLERMILLTTDEGDVVLDPFVGTGTSAVAAKKLNRRYIGFELDEDYARIARCNIDSVYPNSRVNDIWVSFYLGAIKTIRDKDWASLSQSFDIPRDMREIDFKKIELKKSQAPMTSCGSVICPQAPSQGFFV